MILIYCVFKDKEEAQKIGEILIQKRLAVCINTWMINSCFVWKGVMEKSTECAAYIKTEKKYFETVKAVIAEHHSYDAPCIIELPIGRVHAPYSEWLSRSLG